MSKSEHQELVEILQDQNDYDVYHLVKQIFGFAQLNPKREWNPVNFLKNRNQQILSEDKESHKQKNFDNDLINPKNNFYEKLKLESCSVNIFALKRFIMKNIKSLREIIIHGCHFFLSDSDCDDIKKRTENRRMLSEINFVYLIEQFKFQDIMIIDIKLVKEIFDEESDKINIKSIYKQHSAKVVALEGEIDSLKNKDQEEEEVLSKEELMKQFRCNEECKFIKYELDDKPKFLSKFDNQYMQRYAEKMIWGDIQDQNKFIDKLCDNTLNDIQQNLDIYKKYTKYAFNDGKLIIIEDVLHNGVSVNQLYNLIQLNCKQINGIIFKDNGKIEPKAFSDLMKQIFVIQSLEQITFFSSVLDESSLYELQYLIQVKGVKFLNLYRSYFLSSELVELLGLEQDQLFIINHQRFVILDILMEKSYEFTPYAFNLSEMKEKKKQDLLEVERLYRSQNYYPKQILNQIVFFQGKNLTIVNKNASETILFKYWDILNYKEEEKRLIFLQKQDILIKILESIFREDDIHILNYSLIKLLITLVIEEEPRQNFETTMKNSKSFKLLSQSFLIKAVEKIKFEKLAFLYSAYSYIYGFTRFQDIKLYYIMRNDLLHSDIRENNQDLIKKVKELDQSLTLKESFSDTELSNEKVSKILKEISIFMNYSAMSELILEVQNISSYIFLNFILPKCESLKKMSLSHSLLNDEKLKGVNFSLISSTLESFYIYSNRNIENLAFLEQIFGKAKKLKELNISNMQILKAKAETLNFYLFPSSLEELNYSFNPILESTYINQMFQCTPNLRKVDFSSCQITSEIAKTIKFGKSLKEINLNFNQSTKLIEFLILLGTIEGAELESIEIFVAPAEHPFTKEDAYYLIPGSLKAFQKLKKIRLQRNRFSDSSYLNLILAHLLPSSLSYLMITDQTLKDDNFKTFQFSNIYSSLEYLDLSYNHSFASFSFLNNIFQQAVQLKTLNLSFSSMTNSRMFDVKMIEAPLKLEEFLFSGNISFTDYSSMLNPLFERCKELRLLSITAAELTDEKIRDVRFDNISPKFESLFLYDNNKLENFAFLNSIFKVAKGLKKLKLKKLKISKYTDIQFDLINNQLEIFEADDENFFTEEFQDWLSSKMERAMNIKTFQTQYSNLENYSLINYFGIFEQYNLSQFRSSSQVPKYKQDQKNLNINLKKQKELKEKKEKEKQEDEEQKKKRRELNSQWAIKNNMSPLDNWVENSNDASYVKNSSPLFYYTLLKKIDQLISQPDDQIGEKNFGKSKQNLGVLIEKVVEQQNVYMNKDYLIIQLRDEISLKEKYKSLESISKMTPLEFSNLFLDIKEINLKNQSHETLFFFQFLIQNCDSITKIDMSNMNLTNKLVSNLTLKEIPTLLELNFSGNQCSETNIMEFINQLLSFSPSLQKLNLSNMDMNPADICDFDQVSSTIQELDLSVNPRFPSLQILDELLKRSTGLLKLNLSNLGLVKEKIWCAQFELSATLQELDISNNEELEEVEFLNRIFRSCVNLIKLNLRNCGIDYKINRKLNYYSLPASLKELDLSKNQIVYFMDFIQDILGGAKSLEIFNFSDQKTSQQYDTINNEIPANNIKDFDFSGNFCYNSYPFIQEMIKNSTQFNRLTIKNCNSSQRRLEHFGFDKIGNQIQEIDISDNQNFSQIDSLNNLSKSPNFISFIANNTNLNNQIFKDLQISEVFKNLKRLELAQNVQFLRFDFMNDIFNTARQLEILNLSKNEFTQSQMEQINFKLTPPTLQEFNIGGNKKFSSFSFLTTLFQSTLNSLKKLIISDCSLTEELISTADFSLLSKGIEEIDISQNKDLTSINFVEKLFSDSLGVHLKKFKITKLTYQIGNTLQNYLSQIDEVECPFQSVEFEFFTQKYTVHINILKFLRYLLGSNKSSSALKKRSRSQNLFEDQDSQGQIFKLFLKNLMEYKSEQKPLNSLVHFFFMLMNEEKFYCKQLESQFFIMSPFSLFQTPNSTLCEFDKQKKHGMIIDSFNLAFLNLGLLNKPTNYIFGYNKFFFTNFIDFYVQSFPEKDSALRFIIELKNKMDQYKVLNAFLPIRLQLYPELLKQVGLNEFDVLYLINFVPPAVMDLRGMSIQFVKSWYAINFYSPLSESTLIEVDYELLENSSIANFLTLSSYRLYVRHFEGKTFTSKCKRAIGSLSYSFFSFLSSLPLQYRFDHTVIHLENRLKQYVVEGKHNVLRALFPIYIFICIFGIWFFSEGNDISCGNGVSWYSYLTYLGFGLLTLLLEAYIFYICLKYVQHLIPELKPDCRISFPYPQLNALKLFIINLDWINQWVANYIISFFLSQLSRFDYFTNIGFIYTTYSCGDYTIFILALISVLITTFTNIVFFILNFMGNDTYGRLITGQIDKLYQLCNLLEFQAVADVLDIISPSNSVVIFGKMFNQRIINNFIRILFQDIPFIIIQAIYLIKKGEFHNSMIFSLGSSGLMFLVSLNKFLTITPSRLGQEDFNELNEIKRNRVLPNYLSKLSEYESQVTSFNYYEMMKCIKSSNYYQKYLSQSCKFTPHEQQQQLKMIKDLRQFQCNVEFIEEFFGNSDYNDNNEEFSFNKEQILNDAEFLKNSNNHEHSFDQQQKCALEIDNGEQNSQEENIKLINYGKKNSLLLEIPEKQLKQLSETSPFEKASVVFIQSDHKANQEKIEEKDQNLQSISKKEEGTEAQSLEQSELQKKDDNQLNKQNVEQIQQ